MEVVRRESRLYDPSTDAADDMKTFLDQLLLVKSDIDVLRRRTLNLVKLVSLTFAQTPVENHEYAYAALVDPQSSSTSQNAPGDAELNSGQLQKDPPSSLQGSRQDTNEYITMFDVCMDHQRVTPFIHTVIDEITFLLKTFARPSKKKKKFTNFKKNLQSNPTSKSSRVEPSQAKPSQVQQSVNSGRNPRII